MPLNKALHEITEQDLQNLVNDEVAEGKTIEYKRALPALMKNDKTEFLRDVSSFANALGGDLIYGIKEQDGVASEVCGFETDNSDEAIRRLDNLIRDGIQPRIIGIFHHCVKLGNERHVFILRIPKSFAAPHMVTHEKDFRFYARNLAGKCALDVSELRTAFALSESLNDRIRNFRAHRLSMIMAGETPAPLSAGPKTVLHLVPLRSFEPGFQCDLNKLSNYSKGTPPMYGGGHHTKYNFDGYFTVNMELGSTAGAYLQIFRNGIIEAVECEMLKCGTLEKPMIPHETLERNIIKSTTDYLQIQNFLNVEPPLLIMLSLLGVKGYSMPESGYDYKIKQIDRDSLVVPELSVENFPEKVDRTLKPAFDAIWNACGFPFSINYDKEGNWKPNPNRRFI